MNLKTIRYRFCQFLKQFRIEDLKLLMKFLELIVNEYNNSKASRLFDLLSDCGDVGKDSENDAEDDDINTISDDLDRRSSKKFDFNRPVSNVSLSLKKKILKEKNLRLKRQSLIKLHQERMRKTKLLEEENNRSKSQSMSLTEGAESVPMSSLGSSSITITSDKNQENLNDFTIVNLDEQIMDQNGTHQNDAQEEIFSDLNLTSDASQAAKEGSSVGSSGKCVVCGDNAFSARYSRLACEACIEFFRRNYICAKTFVCVKTSLPPSQSNSVYQTNIESLSDRNLDEPCEINKDTRYKCRKCRMDKAIKCGLKLPNGFRLVKSNNQDLETQSLNRTRQEDILFEEQLKELMSTNLDTNLSDSLDSNDIDSLLLNRTSTHTSSGSISKRHASELASDNPPRCGVCTDMATGVRYGVWVCEGCKEFFRRQRVNISIRTMECVTGSNDCEINTESRTLCRRCRFDKCVKLGMKLVGRYVKPKPK